MKKFIGYVIENRKAYERAMINGAHGSSIRKDADDLLSRYMTLGQVHQSISSHLSATSGSRPTIDPSKPKSKEWHQNYQETMGQPYLPSRPPMDADGNPHILSPVTTHHLVTRNNTILPISTPLPRSEVEAQLHRAGEAMSKMRDRLLTYPHIDHDDLIPSRSGRANYVSHGSSRWLHAAIDSQERQHGEMHTDTKRVLRGMAGTGATLNLNHGEHGAAVNNIVLGRDPEVIHHAGPTRSETNENTASYVSLLNMGKDTIIKSFVPLIKESNVERRSELTNHIVNYIIEKKNDKHIEGHASDHSKPATGPRAESEFVRGMGGKASRRKAGSKAPDFVLSHSDHGSHLGEMKAGNTIDLAQQRFAVNPESGRLQHTTKGKMTQRLSKLVSHIQKRMAPLSTGKVKHTWVSRKTGKPKTKDRAAASTEVKDRKLYLNWKNTHSLMGSNEAVHIHVHPKTGHTVIVPNKKEHHHLGKKMGLKKTVSFYSLSQSRGKNKSGFSLRGFRPKGSSMNASFHGSSAHLVNAVRDAGGHVFDSIDHATKHLTKHGWSAQSGHKR